MVGVGQLRKAALRGLSLVETRWGTATVFVASLVVWWLQAIVIPLGSGRDIDTYLGAYAQLFHSHPIDLGYVLGRTPGAPLVVGGLLDIAGGAFAEPGTSLLYALSITAWFLAARRYGAVPAVVTTAALLAYPGYGILFHELASDVVFAAAFAGWSLLAVRVMQKPTVGGFTLLGLGIGILALVRPGNQVLVVLAPLVLLLPFAWDRRFLWAGAFIASVVVVYAGWTVHNGLRYDDYVFSRNGNENVPFYRAFLVDRIVRPENGRHSRALAVAVRRNLLAKEPYRSYHITMERFFAHPTPRMWADLLTLSDDYWGWHTNNRILREVGLEAVRRHPLTYARGVAHGTLQLLYQPLFRVLSTPPRVEAGSVAANQHGAPETVVIAGKRLPKPSEGEAIPSPAISTITTPHNTIQTVWTSPTAHHLVFDRPGDRARYLALQRRLAQLRDRFPNRAGVPTLALRFNQASRGFPPPLLFLVVGVGALAVRRPARSLALLLPTLAGLVVILITAAGVPSTPEFSVPVAPAFILLAAAGLFGPRRGDGAEPGRTRSV